MDRARRQIPRGAATIARNYGRCIDRLTAMPATFIHGEFYPSNVLVQDGVASARSIGRPRRRTRADRSGGAVRGRVRRRARATARREYGAATEIWIFCRLHLAIQWLGWSADWKPPEGARARLARRGDRASRKLGVA
jgi:hypothetical protein